MNKNTTALVDREQLSMLVKLAQAGLDADTIGTLLATLQPAPKARKSKALSKAELADAIPENTGVQYLAEYVKAVCTSAVDSTGKRIPSAPLFVWRKYWPADERGEYYGKHALGNDASKGLPIYPERINTWTTPASPSEASLLATWRAMPAESKATIVSYLQRLSTFAPVRDDYPRT